MRPWMIVAATMLAASTNASAPPDRTPPPGISSTPNLGCQARTGGLAVPPGETGSANLSDELSRSRGVICPPPEVDPGISAQPRGGGLTPVIPPPGSPGGDPRIIPK
jgi:hypothetical protein